MHALVAIIYALSLQAEAGPVKVWTGAAPSGSCRGTRVVMTTDGKIYVCVSGTWTARP